MPDPGIQALRADPGMAAGAAIPFRFEITWRSLTRPLGPAATAELVKSPQHSPAPPAPGQGRGTEAKEWELVLPRMKRPATLPAVSSLAAPSFGVSADAVPCKPWIVPAGAALVIAAVVAAFYWSGQRPSTDENRAPGMEMGSAGWTTEWASDPAGSARGRQISIYRPSVPMSDYSLEFFGQIEKKSLGWVFRAADSRNYYVGKLEAVNPASPLSITHFAVVNGVEGPHVQRVLASPVGSPWKVRLEARGPRFTVSLQNQVVEDWQDDRLKSGGVGFLNERQERGKVASIQISFTKGGIH